MRISKTGKPESFSRLLKKFIQKYYFKKVFQEVRKKLSGFPVFGFSSFF